MHLKERALVVRHLTCTEGYKLTQTQHAPHSKDCSAAGVCQPQSPCTPCGQSCSCCRHVTHCTGTLHVSFKTVQCVSHVGPARCALCNTVCNTVRAPTGGAPVTRHATHRPPLTAVWLGETLFGACDATASPGSGAMTWWLQRVIPSKGCHGCTVCIKKCSTACAYSFFTCCVLTNDIQYGSHWHMPGQWYCRSCKHQFELQPSHSCSQEAMQSGGQCACRLALVALDLPPCQQDQAGQ